MDAESTSSTLCRLAKTLPGRRSRAQLDAMAAGFAFAPVDDAGGNPGGGEGGGGSSQRMLDAYCTRRRARGRRRPSESRHKRSKSAVV